MAQGAHIEWTEATWNPVVGCAKVSAGCKNCYAERMSKRLSAMAHSAQASGTNPGRIANYLHVIDKRGAWNGKLFLDDSAIDIPFKWKSPRLIFVNSMSDLFHKDVPLPFIQRVFKVMNHCSRHTFQILTKRPERAAEFSKRLTWSPNIWMGTSVENALVTHRIKDVRRTHAATKFLSIEPLLGPMPRLALAGIDWVIVGGESGPGARPMEKEWVIQIKNRCIAHSVRFFFKQWGGVNKKRTGRLLEGRFWNDMPSRTSGDHKTRVRFAIS